MKMGTIELVILVVIVGFALAVGVKIGWDEHGQRLTRELNDLNHYRQTYLREQGLTALYTPPEGAPGVEGNYFYYNLLSIDGGKQWIALERGTGRFLGLADDLYPGLMDRIRASRESARRAIAGQPLILGNPDDHKLLEGMGFTIVEKRAAETALP